MASELSKIDFDSLFEQALLDWPETLDFGRLVRHTSDLNNYTVPALEILDGIEKKYFNTDEEVLLRNMNLAIGIILRRVAAYCLSLTLSQLRREFVRAEFERSLESARSQPSWRKQDLQLIDRYFLLLPKHVEQNE